MIWKKKIALNIFAIVDYLSLFLLLYKWEFFKMCTFHIYLEYVEINNINKKNDTSIEE